MDEEGHRRRIRRRTSPSGLQFIRSRCRRGGRWDGAVYPVGRMSRGRCTGIRGGAARRTALLPPGQRRRRRCGLPPLGGQSALVKQRSAARSCRWSRGSGARGSGAGRRGGGAQGDVWGVVEKVTSLGRTRWTSGTAGGQSKLALPKSARVTGRWHRSEASARAEVAGASRAPSSATRSSGSAGQPRFGPPRGRPTTRRRGRLPPTRRSEAPLSTSTLPPATSVTRVVAQKGRPRPRAVGRAHVGVAPSGAPHASSSVADEQRDRGVVPTRRIAGADRGGQ